MRPYEEHSTAPRWGSSPGEGEPELEREIAWERRLDVTRWVFTAVIVAVVAVSVTVVVWRMDEPAASRTEEARQAAPVPDDHVTVLRDWDRERAEAWATGDADALGSLYTPRSRAGQEDVRRLKAWRDRGWTVVGVAPQLVSVTQNRRSSGELVLTVVDRLTGATAQQGQEQVRLPDTAQRARQLTLRRDGGRWRMAKVSDVSAAP